MITITTLDGPYAGNRSDVTFANMHDLFDGLISHDWNWKIDYIKANRIEELYWRRHEIIYRVLRHLTHGRVVIFMGKAYRGLHQSVPLNASISSCFHTIVVIQENASGLEIGINTQSSAN